MRSVYIKFLTEADRASGFFEIAKRSGISSLPGQVYQVPLAALSILEAARNKYRRATDAEVMDAHVAHSDRGRQGRSEGARA